MIVTGTTLAEFLARHRVAVMHIDAEWDAELRERMRMTMRSAETALGDQASFGEMDCDAEPDFCRSIALCNVPCIAYYRDGKFVVQMVGVGQDILAAVRMLISNPMATPKMLREIGYHLRTK